MQNVHVMSVNQVGIRGREKGLTGRLKEHSKYGVFHIRCIDIMIWENKTTRTCERYKVISSEHACELSQK